MSLGNKLLLSIIKRKILEFCYRERSIAIGSG